MAMTRKFAANRPLTDQEEAEIQAQIAADPDSAELTDEQAKGRMTFAEALKRGRGRPKLHNAKQAVTLRLDPDVLARFKAKGDDWRARMAKALKDAS